MANRRLVARAGWCGPVNLSDMEEWMNSWNKPPLSWGAEEALGACLAVALVGALVISLWPGWGFIGRVLAMPFEAIAGAG